MTTRRHVILVRDGMPDLWCCWMVFGWAPEKFPLAAFCCIRIRISISSNVKSCNTHIDSSASSGGYLSAYRVSERWWQEWGYVSKKGRPEITKKAVFYNLEEFIMIVRYMDTADQPGKSGSASRLKHMWAREERLTTSTSTILHPRQPTKAGLKITIE